MGWLQSLAAEFAITVSDGTVWLSIGQGLLVGAVCLLFGIWVARFVGLLETDAPAGETLAVGLASGLLVLTAWWAAAISGGRSSFTPVAVGFAIAIGLGLVRQARPPEADFEASAALPVLAAEPPAARSARRRSLIVAVLSGALFVTAIALLYGSTMAPSARDGVQPLEFNDEAYYSVLGADLAKTGTESLYSPSGFPHLRDLPVQTWYHWGELWLASAVITIFGAAPLQARNFVVLPILLLAAAALLGTLVRQMTRSASLGAFVFGFIACVFLAPLPLIPGPFFSSFARGMIFGITAYGLAAVAVLLALYGLATMGRRDATWALAGFAGTAAALIVPAHVVVAVLALVGVASVWTIPNGQSLVATRRLPQVAPVWQRTFLATGGAIGVTVAWGLLSGHGIWTSGLSPSVSPFNAFWRESVAITTVSSGIFLAIGVAWFSVRKKASVEADLYLGTVALLVTGALLWGARLGDFKMFYVLFAGILVFATPAAAVAVWSIWLRLRAAGHARLSIALLVLCGTQLEFGAGLDILRLQSFGPPGYEPVPSEILEEIRALPPDAKLAYACLPFEEVAFWEARLLSLDAHTGRRIMPMCFQAETFASLSGTPPSADVPSPFFQNAPQRTLYPDSGAHPSEEEVASFLKDHEILYIYADALHPNTLFPGAIPIATSGETQVLRLP